MLVVTDCYFCSHSAVKVTNYWVWKTLKGGATECYCRFVGKIFFSPSYLKTFYPPAYYAIRMLCSGSGMVSWVPRGWKCNTRPLWFILNGWYIMRLDIHQRKINSLLHNYFLIYKIVSEFLFIVLLRSSCRLWCWFWK